MRRIPPKHRACAEPLSDCNVHRLGPSDVCVRPASGRFKYMPDDRGETFDDWQKHMLGGRFTARLTVPLLERDHVVHAGAIFRTLADAFDEAAAAPKKLDAVLKARWAMRVAQRRLKQGHSTFRGAR